MMYIDEQILKEFAKYFVFYYCTFFIFIKIVNYKDSNILKIATAFIISILLTIIFIYLNINISYLYAYLTTYFIYSFFMKLIIRKRYLYCVLITLISLVITYIFFFISMLTIGLIFYFLMDVEKYALYISLVVDLCVTFAVLLFINVKKIKNGINFLKDENKIENITGIIVTALFIIACAYSIKLSAESDLLPPFIATIIGILGITIFIWIKSFLSNYYIKDMNKRTINNLNESLNHKDIEIENLNSEIFKLAKKNHSLNHELNVLHYGFNKMWSSANLPLQLKEELQSENPEFISLMENISSEYKNNTHLIADKYKLAKTDIASLDLILEYMQHEAYKQKINFILKIKGSIRYMIENIINEENLAELLKDHIKDAIIAVKSSDNSFKSIMVILGDIDKNYGLRIFDSGLEFEIDTLVNLGIQPITTHQEEGGTGFGFVNTFDVLELTQGSLVIEEIRKAKTSYTKIINIIFDNKNEYRIYSYRADLIKKQDLKNRIQIRKGSN